MGSKKDVYLVAHYIEANQSPFGMMVPFEYGKSQLHLPFNLAGDLKLGLIIPGVKDIKYSKLIEMNYRASAIERQGGLVGWKISTLR